MSETKTHYRKAFNSPYLSSADIVEPTVLTVSRVTLETDKSKKTKDFFNTLHFIEQEIRKGEKLKPMILNAGNSKIMAKMSGSPFIDDWHGMRITVYVDNNVRFGRETVEGLRIDPNPPQQKEELTANHKMWQGAVAAYKRDKNFSKIEARMTISEENKNLIIKEAGNAKP